MKTSGSKYRQCLYFTANALARKPEKLAQETLAQGRPVAKSCLFADTCIGRAGYPALRYCRSYCNRLGQALHSGAMGGDYWKNHTAAHGKIKLGDFAKEFAAAYSI